MHAGGAYLGVLSSGQQFAKRLDRCAYIINLTLKLLAC